MPTPTQVEDMRRQRHVMEVSDAIDARLAAARTAQTVLDDLVASGRVDVAHTNPCWVALEDELHWLGAAAADIDLADGYAAAYDLCSSWAPEVIRRGVHPTEPRTPIGDARSEILAYLDGDPFWAVSEVIEGDEVYGQRFVLTPPEPVAFAAAMPVAVVVEYQGAPSVDAPVFLISSFTDAACERRPHRFLRCEGTRAELVEAITTVVAP